MDDLRIEWIKSKLYNAYQISLSEDAFEKFLESDGGKHQEALLEFLDQPCELEGKSVIFYVSKEEREIQVEVECGKLLSFII